MVFFDGYITSQSIVQREMDCLLPYGIPTQVNENKEP